MILGHKTDGTFQATHGLSLTPLYNVFRAMHNRCEDVKNPAYPRYGGRGIKVCAEWSLDNIDNFISWAFENGWKKGLEIDRINNNKGYSPDNCRIVTPKENSRNRRSNRYVVVNNERMLLIEAIEKYSVVTKKQFELRYYHQKWPLEKALFQPIQTRKKYERND